MCQESDGRIVKKVWEHDTVPVTKLCVHSLFIYRLQPHIFEVAWKAIGSNDEIVKIDNHKEGVIR